MADIETQEKLREVRCPVCRKKAGEVLPDAEGLLAGRMILNCPRCKQRSIIHLQRERKQVNISDISR